MANKYSTITELNPCMSKNLPNAEQIKYALYDIADMALALRHLCSAATDDETGFNASAAEYLASKIGWTADRCLGFQVNSSDQWLMSPRYNSVRNTSEKEQEATE